MLRVKGTVYAVVVAAASAPRPDKSADPLKKELIVPYWLVRTTGDKEKANMYYSTMKCTMSIAAGKEESAEDAVMIPILQNSRVLNEGDELFTNKEAIEPPKESLAPAPKQEAAPSASKRLYSGRGPQSGKLLDQPKKKARKR